jgi:hypothetical protein
MAHAMRTPSGDVVLVMSFVEARGLRALADEGAEGLRNDKAAAKAYIGNKQAQDAAERALTALTEALWTFNRSKA